MAICNVCFWDDSLHLPSNTCIRCKVHFAILNLEDALKNTHTHGSNMISLNMKMMYLEYLLT